MGALQDRQDNFRAGLDPYGAVTHEVLNQPVELADFNLYDSDAALKEAVKREGAGRASAELEAFGARAGSSAFLELGVMANRNPPELESHDRYGRRIDLVRYHPSYHALMKASIEDGLHSSPWTGRGRACRPRRALLYADRGRGRPRLPDHYDLRRHALPQA
jgi:putative acyl-CoA dehydrogenase